MLLLLSATLLCAALFARASAEVEDPDVVVLTADNFDEVVNGNAHTLVEFYAPWCGHCKHLAPEYAKAATALKGEVVLAKVDATIEKDLATRFDVRGFPTLKFFRGDASKASEYGGGRTEETIVTWLRKKTGPPAQTFASQAELDAFVAAQGAVVAFFGEQDSDDHKAFLAEAVDDATYEEFLFAQVFDAAAVAAAGAGVTLYTSFAEPRKHADLATLRQFVLDYGYPLVPEIDGKVYQRLIGAGNPLAILFVNPEAPDISFVEPVAEALRGKFSFGSADGVRYGQQIQRMGGPADATLPYVAALSANQKFNYPYDGELTPAALQTWAEGILSGDVAPHIKSEEIPADNSGPVTVVVNKNFDAVVMDSTKDVLLEVYAPWCGHCKQLAPIYEELGEEFKDVEGIVIAKVDGTANDLPTVEYRGFPTLKWFPANDKKEGAGIEYEGGRTLKDLSDFIRKEATVAIPASSAPAATASDDKEEL